MFTKKGGVAKGEKGKRLMNVENGENLKLPTFDSINVKANG